jgi:hypothetical protein
MIDFHASVGQILAFGTALILMAVLRVHGERLKRVLRREATYHAVMTEQP